MSAQALGDPTAAPKSTHGAVTVTTDNVAVESTAGSLVYDDSKATGLWQHPALSLSGGVGKFEIPAVAYYPEESDAEHLPEHRTQQQQSQHHQQQAHHLSGYSLLPQTSEPKQNTPRFTDVHYLEAPGTVSLKDADLLPATSDLNYEMVIGVDSLGGRPLASLAAPSSCQPANPERSLALGETLAGRLAVQQHTDLSTEYHQYFFPNQEPLLLMNDFKTMEGRQQGNLRSAQVTPETSAGTMFPGAPPEALQETAVSEDTNSGEAALDSCHGETGGALGVGSQCLICGDRATGKHYGAYSCDGCKGFFRRSVRRNHSYTCRHMRMCVVTKDKRNQCRFCRLRKCFRVGMKKSAVQNERDKISTRSLNYDASTSGQPFLDLQQLMQAERQAHSVVQKTLACTLSTCGTAGQTAEETSDEMGTIGVRQLADVPDICDSIKTQLIFLIEWAKYLPTFAVLSVPDQIALLQSHAGEMLIIGAVWRSLSSAVAELASPKERTPTYCRKMVKSGHRPSTSNLQVSCSLADGDPSLPGHRAEVRNRPKEKPVASGLISTSGGGTSAVTAVVRSPQIHPDPDLILLGNRKIISRLSPRPEISEVASLIFDQLYHPMQDLCLEDAEIAFLRAIIFFDPNSPGLSEMGRQTVRTCQYHLQMELMNIMNDKLYLPQGRFGALLLLLPDLRLITLKMVGKLHLATELGLTRFDELISDILLTKTQSETGGEITAPTGKSGKARCKSERNPEQRSPAATWSVANRAAQLSSSTGEDYMGEGAGQGHLEAVGYPQRTAAYVGQLEDASGLPYLGDLPAMASQAGLSVDLVHPLPNQQSATAFHPIRQRASLSRPLDSGIPQGLFDGVFGEGTSSKWTEGSLRHSLSGSTDRHPCCSGASEEYRCNAPVEQTPALGYTFHGQLGPFDQDPSITAGQFRSHVSLGSLPQQESVDASRSYQMPGSTSWLPAGQMDSIVTSSVTTQSHPGMPVGVELVPHLFNAFVHDTGAQSTDVPCYPFYHQN